MIKVCTRECWICWSWFI